MGIKAWQNGSLYKSQNGCALTPNNTNVIGKVELDEVTTKDWTWTPESLENLVSSTA